MINEIHDPNNKGIIIDEEAIEKMSSFDYLESMVNNKESSDESIR